jgi:hypothetical protein
MYTSPIRISTQKWTVRSGAQRAMAARATAPRTPTAAVARAPAPGMEVVATIWTSDPVVAELVLLELVADSVPAVHAISCVIRENL